MTTAVIGRALACVDTTGNPEMIAATIPGQNASAPTQGNRKREQQAQGHR